MSSSDTAISDWPCRPTGRSDFLASRNRSRGATGRPFRSSPQILECGHQITHGPGHIGLKVAPPDDAFPGVQVDQDHGPLLNAAQPIDDRAFHGNHHGTGADPLEGQFLGIHRRHDPVFPGLSRSPADSILAFAFDMRPSSR